VKHRLRDLQRQFDEQQLANGYELVDGVAMHAENGERFQIPHPVLKKHVGAEHFVELRIDSPRFSAYEIAPKKCACPTCNGEATKPVLCHEHPATLLQLPKQNVPSRGWGDARGHCIDMSPLAATALRAKGCWRESMTPAGEIPRIVNRRSLVRWLYAALPRRQKLFLALAATT
jgi:hypothetical protein